MRNIFFSINVTLLVNICNAQAPQTVWTQTANPLMLPVNGVAFSKNGNKVVTGTDCHPARIRTYDVTNGNVTWDYTVGDDFMCIMGVGFSSNGNYIAGVEEMGNILVFDNTQPSPVLTSTIAMNTMYAFAIDFAPNNCKMVVGGANGKLQTYHTASGIADLNVSAHSTWVNAVNYSPDNLKIASGGSDAIIKIWDTTGTLLQTLNSHTDDITALRFSKDNNKLLSVSLDDKIKLWDVASGTLLNTLSPQAGNILGIDISADNTRFVTVSADKQIRIYNLATLTLETSFGSTTAGTPRCVAWSQADASKIAVGYSNGTVILYNKSVSTVGIADVAARGYDLLAYPNPSAKEFVASWKEAMVQSIEITDLQGRQIFKKEVPEGQRELELPEHVFPSRGVYILSCKTAAREVLVKKLIKQ